MSSTSKDNSRASISPGESVLLDQTDMIRWNRKTEDTLNDEAGIILSCLPCRLKLWETRRAQSNISAALNTRINSESDEKPDRTDSQ